MAALITLADLIAAAKDRSDMQNSNFITKSEWTRYINSAAKELYDILISRGLNYTTISASFAVDGVADTFALPSDFYKLEGIDYTVGGSKQAMTQFQFLDRNKYQHSAEVVQYRLVGQDKITFCPRPAAQTYTLWYVPVLQALSADSDTLNGVHGWEEYVIIRAAIYALQKEESDTGDLKQDLMFTKDRIELMSQDRDQGLPSKVSDAKGASNIFDPLFGWGYY